MVETDTESAELVRDRRFREALTLLQHRRRQSQRRRAPFDELLEDLWQLKRAGAPFTRLIALLAAQLLVIAGVIVVLTAVGLTVANGTLFPAMDRLFAVALPLVFKPGVLPVLAAATLVVGILFAGRFRSPATFVAGLAGVSLGLVCFWLFPLYIRLLQQRVPPEAELPMLIVGGVVSLLLLFADYSSPHTPTIKARRSRSTGTPRVVERCSLVDNHEGRQDREEREESISHERLGVPARSRGGRGRLIRTFQLSRLP